MINQKYKDAYKEVLEIIKYLPQNELSRIPKEKIEYFQRNQNSNHTFNFDSSIALEEQNISREANAIILNLFNDYFISDNQKEKLINILKSNEIKYQEKQKEKYNPDNIFNNSELINDEEQDSKKLPVSINKKGIFAQIIEYLKKFLLK